MQTTFNLATIITLIRLIASPLLLPLLLVYVLPYNNIYLNSFLAVIFAALSFTDFLDGYYARKYNQTSKIGAALDHIADKFLTNSTLIALLAVGKINYFWVILFVGRDLFIMGLRMIALEHNFNVPVGFLGKIKTALLMLLITLLILNPYQALPQEHTYWHTAEIVLLAISVTLTLISAYGYTYKFLQVFKIDTFLEQD